MRNVQYLLVAVFAVVVAVIVVRKFLPPQWERQEDFVIAELAAPPLDVAPAGEATPRGPGPAARGSNGPGRVAAATGKTDAARAPPRPPLDLSGADPEATADRAVIGDELRIVVFQELDAPGGDRVGTLLERTEVGGTFRVGTDGMVRVPFIGAVAAYGVEPTAIERRIAAEVEATFGGKGRVNVTIASRPRVSVTGRGIQPRSIAYTPGMLVVEVVARAIGDTAPTAFWQRLDVVRERERLLLAQREAARLAAEQAVLLEETGEGAPSARSAPAAEIEKARRRRALVLDEHRLEVERAELELRVHRSALAEQESQLRLMEEIVARRRERVEATKRMLDRQITTSAPLEDAYSELNTAIYRLKELRRAMMEAESGIQELEQRLTELGLRLDIERERRLREIDERLSDLRLTIATRSSVALTDAAAGPSVEEWDAFILRRTPGGMERMRAGVYDAVLPGDILTLERAGEVPQEGTPARLPLTGGAER